MGGRNVARGEQLALVRALAGETGDVSPATQIRCFLARSRANGVTFDEAYPAAFGRVIWPHDTGTRREWKTLLTAPEMVDAWRAAYLREPGGKAEAIGRLAAADVPTVASAQLMTTT